MSTSNPKTPYEILGVGRYSTQKEIRRRYLELCKKHHPDVAVVTGVDFTEITSAYEFLSNKRSLQRMQSSPYNNAARATSSSSVHQHKPIDTKLWTRRSLIFGLGFAGLMAYSLYDDGYKNEPVLSIPTPRKQQQIIDNDTSVAKNPSNHLKDSLNNTTNDVNNTTPITTTDTSTKPPPWQTAGISFREWRKR